MRSASDLIPGFEPENDFERRVSSDPELLEGVAWGEPRSGHPEGSVGAHVSDLLRTLDGYGEDEEHRRLLRAIALVHDSFKSQVQDWRPRSGANHHAARARRFAERYTDDPRILETVEHHDRPYALWRKMKRKGSLDEEAFDAMLGELPDVPLFLRFVELDGSTEGKDPEPIEWFRDELRRRGLVE